MFISQKTHYGLRALFELTVAEGQGNKKICEIAQSQQIPLRFLEVIMSELRQAGFVESRRGAKGGYRLARSGDDISLADVIRALEGPISMVECATQPGLCEQEANCPVRVNWSRVNREIEHALERVPITEMVTPDPCLSTLQSLGTASERRGES